MGATGSQAGKPGGPGGQSTSPSTSAAKTPAAGGTSPAGATGQVSSTPNAQGLYTDVVGGHTYSQATPWQQYQTDALNKQYAAGAGATGAVGAGQLGQNRDHPHAFTGDREKRLANKQQFFQNQYGGNWQQAMQNQQAFNAATAAEDALYTSGKITTDVTGHPWMDGKPYTPIDREDISRYASYGAKALNPNAGQVYSDGSPYAKQTLNPLQQFLSQQQPNTGSMTGHSPMGHSPMGQQGHKHGGLLSLINKR
jgi:hypothetical protein